MPGTRRGQGPPAPCAIVRAVMGPRILHLGLDLVEIDRVARLLERWGDRLVARLMDPAEADRLPPGGNERTRALAIAIAGKEAASKALGTGWSHGVRWRDVVVDPGPPPSVRLLGPALDTARSRGSRGESHARLEIRGNIVIVEVRLLS